MCRGRIVYLETCVRNVAVGQGKAVQKIKRGNVSTNVEKQRLAITIQKPESITILKEISKHENVSHNALLIKTEDYMWMKMTILEMTIDKNIKVHFKKVHYIAQ